MKPRSKSPHASSSAPARSLRDRWRAWVASKSPVFWFCGKFGLLTLGYYGLMLLPSCGSAMNRYLMASARISHAILNAFGEKCQITEATIWCSQHAISVLPSCSAMELVWFFCAAIISHPAPLLRKVGGIAVGMPLILALNLARIVSLFYVGVHFHKYFETVHEEVWPAALIIATLLLSAGWLQWVRSAKPIPTDVAR